MDNPLGGRCLNLDAATVTTESLVAQGLSEPAARELADFARHLRGECARDSCRYTHPPAPAAAPTVRE